jgi:hypothetical protein
LSCLPSAPLTLGASAIRASATRKSASLNGRRSGSTRYAHRAVAGLAGGKRRLGHAVTIPRASDFEPLAGGTRLASRRRRRRYADALRVPCEPVCGAGEFPKRIRHYR